MRSTQTRRRKGGRLTFTVEGEKGRVAQLLHPLGTARGAIEIASVISELDVDLPRAAEIVLGGAGLISVEYGSNILNGARWTSDEALRRLHAVVVNEMASFVRQVGKLRCHYVFGFDIFLDGFEWNAGQFAVALVNEKEPAILWKSLPVGTESGYLAGLETPMGRTSPRIIDCCLGKALVTVCHDAQSFNHRTRALSRRGTGRGAVIRAMSQTMAKTRPEWVLNLAHQFASVANMKTFRTSYQQINHDFGWHPKVVGAFGYPSTAASEIACLAQRSRVPAELDGLRVILHE
jgi:hypothetical protein